MNWNFRIKRLGEMWMLFFLKDVEVRASRVDLEAHS